MKTRLVILVVVGAGTVVAVALLMRRGPNGGESPAPQQNNATASFVPRQVSDNGYVSSSACRECHKEQHATWHRTYHRTMTQLATAESVVAPFNGLSLTFEGMTTNLKRKADEFWVDMVNPIWVRQILSQGGDPTTIKDAPRIDAQVVMTTGSHHRQSYWVTTKDPSRKNEVFQIPWTFQIDEQRWVPLDAAFLQPLQPKSLYSSWNENCISCHSVAGVPGLDRFTGALDTSVAELGIACESCHGPGQKHVRHYRKHPDTPPAVETIVQPMKLDHRKSSQVCGSCHSVSQSRQSEKWFTHGRVYRPGQDLEQVRKIVRLDEVSSGRVRGSFWNDGTARTGGREYNAMALSGCYTRGKMSCISCHSMHRADDPDHLLADGMEGNKACTTCHKDIAKDVPAHTHHQADSSGSNCYNCHMPHTSYALLSVLRSHRIDSPSVANEVNYGKPNACNLCHLDKTLQWTDDQLVKWYDKPRSNLGANQKTVAASLLHLLGGDAGQRVIVAGNFGREEARAVSGEDWMAPHLAEMFSDPYPAVRWLAFESLRKQEAFRSVKYDFVGSPENMAAAQAAVMSIWATKAGRRGKELLIDAQGKVLLNQVKSLIDNRDQRPTYIVE